MKTIILKCSQKNIIHSDDYNDSNDSNEKKFNKGNLNEEN